MNPLSAIFGSVTSLRNGLYDRRVFLSRRLQRPVVSVGNLSVGGSGKTPFVVALGQLLQSRGVSFDILSRGYRRKTRGVLVVDPNGRAPDFGDEPLLLARRLKVPVVVGASRYHAGILAEEKFDSQLHILDDGFQHRSLARDFDIVLMTASDFDDALLPAGRLREPLSALRRADAIILPDEFCDLKGDEPRDLASDGTNHLLPVVPEPHRSMLEALAAQGKFIGRMRRDLAIPDPPASPIVFCGIARPRQFFAQVRDQLRAAGIVPAAEIAFRDHHAHTQADIARLQTARDKLNAGGFVTTEKDAVNLGPLLAQLQPVAVGALTVTLDHPDDAMDAILARIANRKPRS